MHLRLATLTAMGLVMTLPLVALADNITNDVSGNPPALSLQIAGPAGYATFRPEPTGGDGRNGCNLAGNGTQLVVTVSSSNPNVATVSPTSLTFTSCGSRPSVAVSTVGPGSATIGLSNPVNTTNGSFDLSTATFSVNVALPAGGGLGGLGGGGGTMAATPELGSLGLFATGAAGMAGLALIRFRSRKRTSRPID